MRDKNNIYLWVFILLIDGRVIDLKKSGKKIKQNRNHRAVYY